MYVLADVSVCVVASDAGSGAADGAADVAADAAAARLGAAAGRFKMRAESLTSFK